MKQADGVDYPGCIRVGDSVLARNPDFSDFLISAQFTGLLAFLEQLPSPATLLIPTNEALLETRLAANLTREEALASPLTPGALNYFVIPEPLLVSERMQMFLCSVPHCKRLCMPLVDPVVVYMCVSSIYIHDTQSMHIMLSASSKLEQKAPLCVQQSRQCVSPL